MRKKYPTSNPANTMMTVHKARCGLISAKVSTIGIRQYANKIFKTIFDKIMIAYDQPTLCLLNNCPIERHK